MNETIDLSEAIDKKEEKIPTEQEWFNLFTNISTQLGRIAYASEYGAGVPVKISPDTDKS